MIRLQNITKTYGNLTVLDNVDVEFADGRITTIMGPSGAGKTTLLQIAGTLAAPDRGTVTYDGVEITRMKDRRLSVFRNTNIGFVFQFHQLLPEFTARENVAIPAMIAGNSKRRSLALADELLERLGLAERITHKPSQLSGGERQRVAFARALINNPKVIFADEPTGSLDSRNRDDIRDLILTLNRDMGQTFVIVTHDQEMTLIADDVINMRDGRIITPEVIDTPQNPAEA